MGGLHAPKASSALIGWRSWLEVENAVPAPRHQLIVLRRKMPGRVTLTNNDRWFLVQPYRWLRRH
jgi:hypothetical protein